MQGRGAISEASRRRLLLRRGQEVLNGREHNLVVARVVRELYHNWLGAVLGNRAIQLLNRLLCLAALVEANETDTL